MTFIAPQVTKQEQNKFAHVIQRSRPCSLFSSIPRVFWWQIGFPVATLSLYIIILKSWLNCMN